MFYSVYVLFICFSFHVYCCRFAFSITLVSISLLIVLYCLFSCFCFFRYQSLFMFIVSCLFFEQTKTNKTNTTKQTKQTNNTNKQHVLFVLFCFVLIVLLISPILASFDVLLSAPNGRPAGSPPLPPPATRKRAGIKQNTQTNKQT